MEPLPGLLSATGALFSACSAVASCPKMKINVVCLIIVFDIMIPAKGRNLTRFCVRRAQEVLRVCWVRAGHGEGLLCLTDCGFSMFCFCGVSKLIPKVRIKT